MRLGSRLVLVVLLALPGCARYQMPPLPASHPAHPDAATAPAPVRSSTLASRPMDPPPGRSIPTVASPPAAPAPVATAVGEGEVVATVPAASQIVLDHAEIKGFMEAMTMGYRVEPAALLAGVKPGDRVRFTIDVQRRAIVELEKLP